MLDKINHNYKNPFLVINPTLLIEHKVKDKVTLVQNLNNSAILDTFSINGFGHYEAKSPDESSVMKGHLRHLPLVPGVVQKGLLQELFKISEDIYSGKSTVKTEFGAPILPHDKVKVSMDIIGLEHENGKTAIKLEEVPLYESTLDKVFDEVMISCISEKEIDKVLLQSNKFRFASTCAFLTRQSETDINIGDIFQGNFKIPKTFEYFDKNADGGKIVSPYLIEEMAAQIGVMALSEKTGKVSDENGELIDSGNTMTFNSSICKYTGLDLCPGEEFRLTGRVKDISKRCATFEYIGFDIRGDELIRGEICGNIVSIKILKRLFK